MNPVLKIKWVKPDACAGVILIEMLIAALIGVVLMSVLFDYFVSSCEQRNHQSHLFDILDNGIALDAVFRRVVRQDEQRVHDFYYHEKQHAIYLRDTSGQGLRIIDGVDSMKIHYVYGDNRVKGVEINAGLVAGSLHKTWYSYVALGDAVS